MIPKENERSGMSRAGNINETAIGVQINEKDTFLLTSKPEIRSFEDVLQAVGPIGKWQYLIYFCFGYAQFFTSMQNLGVIYFQITPDFACDVGMNSDWSFEQMKNISSPQVQISGRTFQDPCSYYDRNYSQISAVSFEQAYEDSQGDEPEINTCKRFAYNRTANMRQTIVTQYDLVCSRKYLVEHCQMIYMLGFLLGSFLAGYLSDRFGRRRICCIGAVLECAVGVCLAVAPNFPLFALFRFLFPFSSMFTTLPLVCLIMETTTSKMRTYVGGLIFLAYGFGYTTLSIVAYFTRDWRIMYLIFCIPMGLSVCFRWLLPESPRWLMVQNRLVEANATVQKANRLNNGSLPLSFDLAPIAAQLSLEAEKSKSQQNILQMFQIEGCRLKYPRMVFRAIVIFFMWFVMAMVYYGIALNVSSFAGDVFLNNLLAGLTEIPSYVMCVPLLAWGRKRAIVSTLLIAAACLLAVPCIPEKTLNGFRICIAMLGKVFITSGFSLGYVITPELYPTVIRSSGLSASCAIARIGSAMAPYISTGITKSDPTLDWLPMIIFGVLSLAGGLLTLVLPETKGRKLPDQLEEEEKFGV